MQLLLAHKADVAATNPQGWTPLMLAARSGSAPRVQALLDAGAQHSAVNVQGNTALHL
jgi:ankyrin repeat protein